MKNIAVFETADKSTAINLDHVSFVTVQRAHKGSLSQSPITITFSMNNAHQHLFHTDEKGAREILNIAGLDEVSVPKEIK